MSHRPDKATLAWTIVWDEEAVTSVAFLGNGRLAAGNELGTVVVFDLPGKEGAPAPACRLDGHTNLVTSLAAVGEGRLVSASYDHTLRWWNLGAASAKAEIVLDRKAREAAAKKSGKPASLQGVPVEIHKAERVVEAHEEWIRTICLGGEGRQLLAGDDRGVAILWDAAEAREIRRLQARGGFLRAVALTKDGKRAATCEFTPRYAQFPNTIKVWDVEAGTVKLDLAKDFKKGNSVTGMNAAAFSPDGKLLALGEGGERDGNAKVHLLESETGKKVQEIGGHQYGITSLAFLPDGKALASAGRDTVVRLWGVPDGRMIQELGKPRGGQFKDWIHQVALSPDGKRLAAGDMAGQIHVWSLA
jgi:WD40 repeat protein